MEKLSFDRKAKCDWCGQEEICAITQYGTSHYNRLVCAECAISLNTHTRMFCGGKNYFDLNNSTIKFRFEEDE